MKKETAKWSEDLEDRSEKLAKGQEQHELEVSDPTLIKMAAVQSRRLHAQLTLSLVNSVGPQQALLESGFEDDEDGIMALTRLIKHFEYTTKGLRVLELHEKWQRETLQTEEDPSLLYTRLTNSGFLGFPLLEGLNVNFLI